MERKIKSLKSELDAGHMLKGKITKTMTATYHKNILLKESAKECTRFIRDMFNGVMKVGLPKQPIRSIWMRWNLANEAMDRFRSPRELDYCLAERKKSEIRGAVKDPKTYWRRESSIHLGVQLITSKQVRDENLKTCTWN